MKKFAACLGIISLLIIFFSGGCFALYRALFAVVGMIAGIVMACISCYLLDKIEKKEQDPELEKFCQLYGG